MKKFISLLLVLLLGVSLVACGGGETATTEETTEESTDLTGKPIRILQFISQNLGSMSCEDLVYEGIQEFCAETGSTLEIVEMNNDDTHLRDELFTACSTGKYDLVVTGYWTMEEYVEEAALEFPDIKFVTFDCTINFDEYPEAKANTVAYLCRQNTLSFAAGALAALITESGKGLANDDKVIGFVGGGHVTAIDDFLIGYIQGAHYVDPEIEVRYAYVGDWVNTAKALELATDQYNNGADVSFGVCAPASFGVCEAAVNCNAYSFGVDSDHTGILATSHPDQAEHCISSAIKQFGYQIRDALFTIYDGTVEWGTNHYDDFESGYLTMIETDTYNTVVKEGMPEVHEAYTAICEKLMAGEIEVGTAVGATPEYIAAELAKGVADAGSN